MFRGFLDIIDLLTGDILGPKKSIRLNPKVGKLLEGVVVLFQFRNVLAHGREISASRLSAYWIQEGEKEIFSGGYKNAEEYLIKIGILGTKFIEYTSGGLFFSDSIANHFWKLSQDFVAQTIKALEEKDRTFVKKKLREV